MIRPFNMRIIKSMLSSFVMVAALSSAVQAAEPLEIGVILPMTGTGAFVGETHQKTFQLVEKIVNKAGGIKGRPVKFEFYDDQTNPQVAVQLTNQLLAKRPAVIMGSSYTAMCRAQMPIIATSGTVHYCLSPALYPPKNSMSFAASVMTKELVVAGIRFLRTQGWKRLALLHVTDASGQEGATAVAEALALPENRDVKLVVTQQFAPNDVSLLAQVSNIKAAKADAVIVWASGTSFGTALRSLNDAGVNLPTFTSSSNMVDSQLKQYAGFAPKDMFFPGLSYAAGLSANSRVAHQQALYLEALKSAGLTNDLQTGLVWDPALIVVDAMRHVGADATGAQIHDYIESLHDFAGITGMYDFRSGNQHGVGESSVVIMRWDSGRSSWSAASKLGGVVR